MPDTEPRIEGCDILEPIGEGGFSTVYRGRQKQFDRTVAIKVMRVELTDEVDRERFVDECQIAGRVSRHPNIVTVLDAGISADGAAYIVSEFMAGGSLADQLDDKGCMEVAEALSTGIKLSGAVTAIHAAGISHADIKPDNILVSEYGEPALCDFGVSARSDSTTVISGAVALTLNHAAPERYQGSPPSPASDVYSLASTLYTLIVGVAPFESPTDTEPQATIGRVMKNPVPIPESDVMAGQLFLVLDRALSKEPSDRHPTAAAFGKALQGVEKALGLPATAMVTTNGGTSTFAPIQTTRPPKSVGKSPREKKRGPGLNNRYLVVAAVAVGFVFLAILFWARGGNESLSGVDAGGMPGTTRAAGASGLATPGTSGADGNSSPGGTGNGSNPSMGADSSTTTHDVAGPTNPNVSSPEPGQPDPQHPGQTVAGRPQQSSTTPGNASTTTALKATTTAPPNMPTTSQPSLTPASITATPANGATVPTTNKKIVITFKNTGQQSGEYTITTSAKLSGGGHGLIPGQSQITVELMAQGLPGTATVDGSYTGATSYHITVLTAL